MDDIKSEREDEIQDIITVISILLKFYFILADFR